MPKVILQPHLANEIGVEAETNIEISGNEILLDEFLEKLFGDNRVFRYSITDETKAIRRHINIFVDNRSTKDLKYAIPSEAEIYIFQALSGG